MNRQRSTKKYINVGGHVYKVSEASETILKDIKTKKNAFWKKEKEVASLSLFKDAAKRVPAYKQFLKDHKIDPSKVKTLKDIQNLPPVTKENYLRKNDLEDMCWDGTLNKSQTYTSTSGSTGKPVYFPRTNKLDWESSVIHEQFLKSFLRDTKGPVLVVDCFGMGVWIGGLITYKAFEIIGERSNPVSCITPGINKNEILNALENLSPHYEKTIIAGYPPFVKDIVDEAIDCGLNLRKLNLSFVLAAETISETFRKAIAQRAGLKSRYLDIFNIYGSADLGTMAFETPLTTLIRELALKNKKLFKSLFNGLDRTPTLAQYVPNFTNFECDGDELYVIGDNSIPLVKYRIGDKGGIYSFSAIAEKLATCNIKLHAEMKKAGILGYQSQLPFVFVYERTDMSTTLYGLSIYPETIREVLMDKPYNKYLTGKFTMITKYDDNQDQYLEVNIELAKGQKKLVSLGNRLTDAIVKNLRTKNAEYRELSDYLKKRAHPRIVFWPYESSEHFQSGVKQKWTKKAE